MIEVIGFSSGVNEPERIAELELAGTFLSEHVAWRARETEILVAT